MLSYSYSAKVPLQSHTVTHHVDSLLYTTTPSFTPETTEAARQGTFQSIELQWVCKWVSGREYAYAYEWRFGGG
jgi:hypothetical protein